MDISKRSYTVILILLLFILSCSDENQSADYVHLESQYNDNRRISQSQQELLETFFDELSGIQKELNSINTDDIILSDIGIKENNNRNETDKNKALRKLKKIKFLLNQKDEEINELKKDFPGLKDLIRNYKNEIIKKEKTIIYLKNENYQLKNINEFLKDEVNRKTNKIDNLQGTIKQISTDLNRNYLILIAKKNSNITEIKDSYFTLNYKLKNIEILSNHDYSSYSLQKNGNSTTFYISDSYQFWKNSKMLIVRIKKKWL